MSVSEEDKIDFIGTDKCSGGIILTISDHLDWNDILNHLLILQNKINAYIGFIENGEIYKSYPLAKSKEIILIIIFNHKYDPLNSVINNFFQNSESVMKSIGVKKIIHKFIDFDSTAHNKTRGVLN